MSTTREAADWRFLACDNCRRPVGIEGAPQGGLIHAESRFCGANCLQSFLLDVNNSRMHSERHRRRREIARYRRAAAAKNNQPDPPNQPPQQPQPPQPDTIANTTAATTATEAFSERPAAPPRTNYNKSLFEDDSMESAHALYQFHAHHCGGKTFRNRPILMSTQ